MISSLVQVGNPVIRAKAKPVFRIKSPAIRKLIKDLVDTMRHTNLVGIAAPQIGANKQVFVTEIRPTKLRPNLKKASALRVFINPKIISRSKTQSILMEGCGSLAQAQLFGPVRRPSQVTVRALNENGRPFSMTAKGLLAKVIQHEYDHLQGVVIIDKFTETKKVAERNEYMRRK